MVSHFPNTTENFGAELVQQREELEIMKSRNCAVCGSSDKRMVFRQPLTLPPGRCSYSGYEIVACKECGFVFADTLISQDTLDDHYAGPNKVAQGLIEEGEEARDLMRIDKTLEVVMPLASTESRIFDVGCGTGRLLGLLKQRGYVFVSGIDQSPAAAEIARAKYDVQVTIGSIFDYDERDLGLVTTCHVLEHIVDIPAFLMCLYGLIGKNGTLYVEVPDASAFNRYVNPESPEEWVYIRDLYTHFTPEHMNFFAPVSLRNLMTRFGFEELFCRSEPLGVIASAWRRRKIEVDSTAEREILLYAAGSQELQGGALESIRELALSGREVLVWGAGLHTQRLLAASELSRVNILAFVDSDLTYQGGELAGRPIIAQLFWFLLGKLRLRSFARLRP
jgi:SAM-dependent methyltransferase